MKLDRYVVMAGPPYLSCDPPLRIARAGKCYSVVAQDDTGKSSPAAGALVHAGSRSLKANAAGRACPGKHTGLVWATLTGDVRSNRIA